MRVFGYARDPSSRASPDGDGRALPTPDTAESLALHTPPNQMIPSPAEMYSYDPYSDPALYHLSMQQPYYQSDPCVAHQEHHTPSPAPPPQHVDTRIHSRRSLQSSPPSPSPAAAAAADRLSRQVLTPKKKTPKKRPGRGGNRAGACPILDQPLSILTHDYTIPVRDMDAWVNRSAEDRQLEAERKNGYISRPMNSFMLYRSAYAERVKQFCKENNHQVVSQVTGASWPLEPDSVRKEYERLAILERDNHATAFPEYKFAPNKSGKKRGRDDGGNANERESDGEWGGSSRTKRSHTTGRSSQYGDSRSNTGTPFDDGYHSSSYSPAPMPVQYSLSSSYHQQHYPGRGASQTYPPSRYPEPTQPQHLHPHQQRQQQYPHQQPCQQPQPQPQQRHHQQISSYASSSIDNAQYDRYASLAMQQPQEPSAVVGMPGIDNNVLVALDNHVADAAMVDPNLGGGARYESYAGGYNAPPAEASYHQGHAAVAEGWDQATHAGAAFDMEFENLKYA